MRAMIFAAGMGTRLKPDTETLPKALVKVDGRPLLEYCINNLVDSGVNEIVINVHHFANKIIDYLKEKNNFNIDIKISDESDLLLDTGGGLKKASKLFKGNEPIIIQNVDIYSDINICDMYNYHKKSNSIATLAVRDRLDSSRYLLFNDNNQLCGWENIITKEQIIKRDAPTLIKRAFTGIHIISPKLFSLMPDKNTFSIIELYLNICNEYTILGYLYNNGAWFDIGTQERKKSFEKYILNCKST